MTRVDLRKSALICFPIHSGRRYLSELQPSTLILCLHAEFLENSPAKELRICLSASPLLEDSVVQQLFDPEAFAMDDLSPFCKPYRTAWPPSDNTEALLHFAVQDTGPGMTAEEQGRIFKRYVQASPKTYKEFGGAGLGLWISRRLVEMHGGAVGLQSLKGVGTVFRLYIKVGRKPPQARRSSTTLVSVNSSPKQATSVLSPINHVKAKRVLGRKPRIMVVEGLRDPRFRRRTLICFLLDNNVNLKVLVRLLTNMKCDVTTAGDGAECIAKIEALLPNQNYPYFDLIFMDLVGLASLDSKMQTYVCALPNNRRCPSWTVVRNSCLLP